MQLHYIAAMENDEQLTLRLPADLARALRRLARERKITRSSVVREAVQAYLAAEKTPDADVAWRQVAPLVGSVRLDRAAVEQDALARRIRDHNWRD
jgi:Arc/MetJ-type ribon-helix-helix transcriptional regulator